MHVVRLQSLNDFAEWRGKARQLLLAGISPDQVEWRMLGEAAGLLDSDEPLDLPAAPRPVVSVPRKFIELAEEAICCADPARFDVLYRLLWGQQTDSTLMQNAADDRMVCVTRWASAVRRDSHKMKAFVRFKSIVDDSGLERYAAWFEPEHYTLERTAPFFARRFDGMIWAIVTPYRSAWWNGESLAFGPGGKRSDVPQDDAVEGDWKTYFSSIFNPARLKVSMMKSEMPVKYCRNLPEAELIAPLIRGARQMEAEMIERAASQPPSRHLRQQARDAEVVENTGKITNLADARAAVQGCQRCPLYEHATQSVFGEGPEQAEVMFVGEQPGDKEDLAGKPFIGPAGQLLDELLEEAGIDRGRYYVTNAVKHFKYVPKGKRRLHQRPNSSEIERCRWWLNIERDLIKPKMIVAMGATAAQAVTGSGEGIMKRRGSIETLEDRTHVFITIHPSAVLRAGDLEAQTAARLDFLKDLRALARLLG